MANDKPPSLSNWVNTAHGPDAGGFAKGWGVDDHSGVVTKEAEKWQTDATAGKVRDPLAYGGYRATVGQEADGSYSYNSNASGQQDAVNRYRGMGEAAANREAYHANYASANQSEKLAQRSRGMETGALSLQRGAALGQAPSETTGVGNMMSSQSLQSALAASAGARAMGGHGAPSMAAAAAQAQQEMSAQGAHNAAALAGMRGHELGEARGAYAQGAAGIRGQDLSGLQMREQRAILQADSEMSQRQMNQQAQMGYEGLGYDVNRNALNASMTNEEINSGITDHALAMREQERQRADARMGAMFQAGGAGIAQAADYFARNSGESDGGGGGSSGGGGDITRKDPYGDEPQGDGTSSSDDPSKYMSMVF